MTSAVEQIKAATRLAVADAGGVEASAAALGLSVGQVSRCMLVAHPDTLSLRHAALLQAAGPSVRITAALANLSGCALLALSDSPAPSLLAVRLAAVGAQSGAVFSAAAEALADQHVTRAEAARLAEELHALATDATAAIAALAARGGV
jgi:hypothetical protein